MKKTSTKTAKTYNQLRTEAAAKGYKGKNPTRLQLEDFLKAAKRTYHTVGRDVVKGRRNAVMVAARRVMEENGSLKMADLYRAVLRELGLGGSPTLWNDLGLVLKDLRNNEAVKAVKPVGKRTVYVAC